RAGGGDPAALMDAARLLVFFKGNDAHDYKFSSAVLEDYAHVSPAWRDRYLAASVFSLRGSAAPDSPVARRTKAALKGEGGGSGGPRGWRVEGGAYPAAPPRRRRPPLRPPGVRLGERVLHVPRRRPGDGLAVVAGHHPQRHIDAGGDPGRGLHVAVLDDVLVPLDRDRGEAVAQQVERPPVGRGPPAVEH